MTKVELYLRTRRTVLLVWLFLLPFTAFCQYTLKVIPVDQDTSKIKSLGLVTDFKTRAACLDYINLLPFNLRKKGYITASVDSSYMDSVGASIHLYVGELYRWAHVKTDSVDRELLDAVKWNRKNFDNKTMETNDLQSVQRQMLDYLENNGYPFASIDIDSVEIAGDSVWGILKVRKGPLYKIDSIRNYGTASISNRYLQRYLNIPNGSIYRKDVILSISRRISELPFLQEEAPASLTFLGTGSVVNLTLAPRKSSQVNVLIGLLPATEASNNIYEAPRTKLQFTGEANINLRNSLGNGEMIGLNWQQLQVKSPRLNLAYQQSYLFGSPFGINFNFDLLKKDTTFVTINVLAGMQYAVSSTQSGSVFIQSQQSFLNTVDTLTVKATRQLPPEADVRAISLGVQYEGFNTNYRFNPTKGNEWNLTLAAGIKNIKQNNVIIQLYDKNDPAFSFQSLYDTIKLRSFQFRMKASGAHYFYLTRVSTIKLGVTGGWFESPNIFRNELFQIGGYKLLRGFDEESIYASQFLVATTEYRYIIGRNSYLYSFFDAGWARSKTTTGSQNHGYFGAGIGLALETKAGIFNISYALGKRDDLNLNLRQSKIHFGYVNFF